MELEKKKQVIGITGGIASGKSKVCRYLTELCGLPVINLDQICKQLLEPAAPGWLALQNLTSGKFLSGGEGSAIDRQAFRNALFSDKQFRDQVDGLLHPLARSEMAARIARIESSVLVEIPLLFEAGWQHDVDLVLVVYTDREVQLQRLVKRDRVSLHQAEQAVAAQLSLTEKAEQADYVIDNSLGWENTCQQLQNLADCLCCS